MFPQRNRNFKVFHPKKNRRQNSKSLKCNKNAIYPFLKWTIDFGWYSMICRSKVGEVSAKSSQVCHHHFLNGTGTGTSALSGLSFFFRTTTTREGFPVGCLSIQHLIENSRFSRNWIWLGAKLRCLYTNARCNCHDDDDSYRVEELINGFRRWICFSS